VICFTCSCKLEWLAIMADAISFFLWVGRWDWDPVHCHGRGTDEQFNTLTPFLTVGWRIDGWTSVATGGSLQHIRYRNISYSTGQNVWYITIQYICYSDESDPFIFDRRADTARYLTVHPCLVHGKAPDLSPGRCHLWLQVRRHAVTQLSLWSIAQPWSLLVCLLFCFR
jgi:hypothetical protein